jgi:hypothetical protein
MEAAMVKMMIKIPPIEDIDEAEEEDSGAKVVSDRKEKSLQRSVLQRQISPPVDFSQPVFPAPTTFSIFLG